MGYSIAQTGCDFLLPSTRKVDAFNAAIKLLEPDFMAQHAVGDVRQPHYSFTRNEDFVDVNTIEQFLVAFRFNADTNNDGDIVGIHLQGDTRSMGQELLLFETIAPFVAAGSHVDFLGEDDVQFSYLFDGKTCRVERNDGRPGLPG